MKKKHFRFAGQRSRIHDQGTPTSEVEKAP